MFYICSCCDRGHRYCSDHCRREARQQQRRQANSKYQQTEYGLADHRDRQRDYRERQAQAAAARVTDQSSPCPVPSDSIPPSLSAASGRCETDFKQTPVTLKWIVCIKCGRVGLLWHADAEAKE